MSEGKKGVEYIDMLRSMHREEKTTPTSLLMLERCYEAIAKVYTKSQDHHEAVHEAYMALSDCEYLLRNWKVPS